MSQQADSSPTIDENRLRAALPSNPFFIPNDLVISIKEQFGISDTDLLYFLATKVAPTYSRAPVSHFLVGAAGLTSNGNIFLGTNLEFPPLPLNNSVHGEQFLISQLVMHQEHQLKKVAINAVPCGHCRQFFNELNKIENVQYFLNIGDRMTETSLEKLLPMSFGPKDLGFYQNYLLDHVKTDIQLKPDFFEGKTESQKELILAAVEAAKISYTIYSNSPSGVAIRTKNGKVYSGTYIESAAYNPSLSPLHTALCCLAADQGQQLHLDVIDQVVLFELQANQVSQRSVVEIFMKNLLSHATLEVISMP